MCKVCARSSPLRSTLNTSYIRFGHVSSMYRSSPLRSTLNMIVITHHSKSYIFPSKSKDLSPPAGSALFVRSTKTAGPRVFTMCQNIENHTDICKPWANYQPQLVQDFSHQQYCTTLKAPSTLRILCTFTTYPRVGSIVSTTFFTATQQPKHLNRREASAAVVQGTAKCNQRKRMVQ